MKTFLSIIIPTLNEEKYLPKLLGDLVGQKDKNFEVIIVDASSEDRTYYEAFKFKQLLPVNIYKVKKKNVSFSRNYGTKKAKGDYLVFLDADGRIYSSFIRVLNKLLDDEKGLLFLPYTIPGEKDPQMEVVFSLANLLTAISQYLNKPFANSGSIIIERNFFRRIGGFDEKLFIAEDHNLIQRAHQWGVRAKLQNDLKLKFSLRRMKREGKLEMFYKYLIATIYILLKGDIKEKIFDYQMGGSGYKRIKSRLPIKDNINNYAKIIKKFFKNYF